MLCGLTSPSATYRPSQRRRAKYSPFDEPKEFFWGSADDGDLQSIVDEYATALAPNATF